MKSYLSSLLITVNTVFEVSVIGKLPSQSGPFLTTRGGRGPALRLEKGCLLPPPAPPYGVWADPSQMHEGSNVCSDLDKNMGTTVRDPMELYAQIYKVNKKTGFCEDKERDV